MKESLHLLNTVFDHPVMTMGLIGAGLLPQIVTWEHFPQAIQTFYFVLLIPPAMYTLWRWFKTTVINPVRKRWRDG